MEVTEEHSLKYVYFFIHLIWLLNPNYDFSPDKCTTKCCGARRWEVDALVYDYLVKFEDRMIDEMEKHGVSFV